MADKENIIIKDTLDGLGMDAYSDYLAHALCLAGSCRLKYNGEERELQAGDLMIVRKGKLVERIRPADDFRVKVIYVTSEFIVLSTPLSNYGMKGQLALFLNPIMKLDAGQQELCRRDFEMVEARLAQTGHHFRKDLLPVPAPSQPDVQESNWIHAERIPRDERLSPHFLPISAK